MQMTSSLILFCGDPHGEFRHIIRAVSERKPVACILLGDLHPPRPLHVELDAIADVVWFIHGNHDTDSETDAAHVFGTSMADRNLHGRVVTLPDGTRIAGLGGVFRESVWHPARASEPNFRDRAEHARATPRQDRWRGGPHRKHWSTIYPEEIDRLADLRADILVTHEAGGGHPYGFDIIDTLAQAMGVHTTFHGHQHDRLDYGPRWKAQGFRSFGIGLRGIADQDGNVVVPGELDRVRDLATGR